MNAFTLFAALWASVPGLRDALAAQATTLAAEVARGPPPKPSEAGWPVPEAVVSRVKCNRGSECPVCLPVVVSSGGYGQGSWAGCMAGLHAPSGSSLRCRRLTSSPTLLPLPRVRDFAGFPAQHLPGHHAHHPLRAGRRAGQHGAH